MRITSTAPRVAAAACWRERLHNPLPIRRLHGPFGSERAVSFLFPSVRRREQAWNPRAPDRGTASRQETSMLRIALPNKGRLADDARELFADAGLDVRMAGERALTASLGGEMTALFLRAQDIPEFI